jgi:hypothetical protein
LQPQPPYGAGGQTANRALSGRQPITKGEKMKANIQSALFIFALGVIVMAGMRAADWVIPEPERKPLEIVHMLDEETSCLAQKGGQK